MSNDVFKIVSAIDGVKNSINKGYSVHDELVYSPVDLDRVYPSEYCINLYLYPLYPVTTILTLP